MAVVPPRHARRSPAVAIKRERAASLGAAARASVPLPGPGDLHVPVVVFFARLTSPGVRTAGDDACLATLLREKTT